MNIKVNDHGDFATLGITTSEESYKKGLRHFNTLATKNGGEITFFADSVQVLKTLAFDILTAAAKAEAEANQDS